MVIEGIKERGSKPILLKFRYELGIVPLQILHLSLTPLVGHPFRMVEATNRYTEHSARLIDLRETLPQGMMFPEDIVVDGSENMEEIHDLISSSDIIHLHQTVPLENNELGVDFAALAKGGKIMVRQFHSGREHYERYGHAEFQSLDSEPNITHLVNAQYQERQYPNAIPVPHIIDVPPLPTPFENNVLPRVCYSPSNMLVADQHNRWSSKGYKQTLQVLKSLSNDGLITFDIVNGEDHTTCLQRKSKADIVIDEVFTGSFHGSGLEGLAIGRPTIAYLDQRTAANLARHSGTEEIPFVLANIDTLEGTLRELISNDATVQEIGTYSHAWIKEFYAAAKTIKFYIKIYDELLAGVTPKRNSLAMRSPNFIRQFALDELHKSTNLPR